MVAELTILLVKWTFFEVLPDEVTSQLPACSFLRDKMSGTESLRSSARCHSSPKKGGEEMLTSCFYLICQYMAKKLSIHDLL